ncbi:hypothetical protein HanRHA438_Chr15g0727091 [Helianthus annuus]|uniref:Uncharacterized protein n=1 Tax=Helianthus annuus TaxID=4232 RepID=A0A9K3E3J3_HELAN|nr:hypothetical protein HanXRQr2_Chr15g0714871 [Helianthus annuus]KAJ0452784.1 hypothetical protein HanHA300_Chr15g0582931 [Helianthus annuus]KAJ0474696.1 hypothetical protein HanHA89_Chr15g0632701 [Helianthus annuus]KAJ0650249.1 hypothetical protein HanLR1_Chr15g0593591 [Helianthus annuus]KAJ0833066.1 hypothetical protein HanPSC8_Chr15g0686001 [Helianthus annuus]
MSDHDNCQDFFSLSLPPAERLFQKRRNRFDLLDDHIHVGVKFFATSQEIVREWKLMGEDTLEFENAKRAFAEEREKFNAEKKGLLWRVSDAEQKLAKEKQYVERIAKLEAFVEEKIAENKAFEILAEEMSVDCKWLLTRAVPLIAERIAKSEELAKYMFDLGQAAYNSGRKDGYGEGRVASSNNEKDYHFELLKEYCTLSRRGNAIEVLKKALGDSGPDGGETGPGRQD